MPPQSPLPFPPPYAGSPEHMRPEDGLMYMLRDALVAVSQCVNERADLTGAGHRQDGKQRVFFQCVQKIHMHRQKALEQTKGLKLMHATLTMDEFHNPKDKDGIILVADTKNKKAVFFKKVKP